jgi:hypothetical protein
LTQTKTLPLVKVLFTLDSDEWHGFQSETVWAEQISKDRCRIRNTPFYVKGVNFEDIVFVKNEDGNFRFVSVSIYGGHSTYRILLNRDVAKDLFQKYWAPLESLGCTYESSEGGLILLAVDVPPQADIYKVYALLERGELNGIWSFEEGHCGHPLR